MPNCFQLFEKKDGVVEELPATLASVDDAIRKEMGAPMDSHNWFHGWCDLVGFMFACGKRGNEIKEVFHDDQTLIAIVDFIERNYEVKSWYEPSGRRNVE